MAGQIKSLADSILRYANMNRKRLFLALALGIALVLLCVSAALADDPMKVSMELSTNKFTEPKTIKVSITVTNVVAPDSDAADSTGIGTKNIAAMMEAMGGLSQTSCDDEAFETTLSFLKARDTSTDVLALPSSCEVGSESKGQEPRGQVV